LGRFNQRNPCTSRRTESPRLLRGGGANAEDLRLLVALSRPSPLAAGALLERRSGLCPLKRVPGSLRPSALGNRPHSATYQFGISFGCGTSVMSPWLTSIDNRSIALTRSTRLFGVSRGRVYA
jgi:hypothetical protein